MLPNLDFKNLRDLDEVLAARFCNQDNIFQTNSAHSMIVKPRFHGNNIARFKHVLVSLSESRRFMDIQSKSMACAMKETLHAAIRSVPLENLGFEVVQDFVMNVVRVRSIP